MGLGAACKPGRSLCYVKQSSCENGVCRCSNNLVEAENSCIDPSSLSGQDIGVWFAGIAVFAAILVGAGIYLCKVFKDRKTTRTGTQNLHPFSNLVDISMNSTTEHPYAVTEIEN